MNQTSERPPSGHPRAPTRSFAVLAGAVLPMLFAGCSSVTTHWDYDTTFDFSAFHTYAWLPPPAASLLSDLNEKRVRTAVDRSLAAKGYATAEADPDFLVVAYGDRRSKVDVVDWGYSPGGWYYGPSRMSTYPYEEGELTLDIVDATTKQMVWRGTATGVLERNPTPARIESRIGEAVGEILAGFPPGS